MACVVREWLEMESIGSDNKNMLEASCDRAGRVSEVDKELDKDGNMEESERIFAAFFEDSLFHNLTSVGDDEIAYRHEYNDFGPHKNYQQPSRNQIRRRAGAKYLGKGGWQVEISEYQAQ